MGKETEQLKPTDIVEVEIKGRKYKVTKAFKDDMDADRQELTTKVKTVETDNLTLKQRLDAMEQEPPKTKKGGDDDDGGDDEITFADVMDRPKSAISKVLAAELKKMGINPAKLGNNGDVEQKLELKLAQREWWGSFWKEHDYFDAETHGDLVESALKKLLPTLKDLKPKEARAKIADRVADMLGRKIVKGKLEFGTAPKHEAQPGMQLEGADGGGVDSGENADDTNTNKGKSGSMADDLRKRKEARQKAARGK